MSCEISFSRRASRISRRGRFSKTRGMTSAEFERIHSEIRKLTAESIKLSAEGHKINKEVFWYPVAIVTGMFTVGGTIFTLALKLLSLVFF